jgi:hypothetical protein
MTQLALRLLLGALALAEDGFESEDEAWHF